TFGYASEIGGSSSLRCGSATLANSASTVKLCAGTVSVWTWPSDKTYVSGKLGTVAAPGAKCCRRIVKVLRSPSPVASTGDSLASTQWSGARDRPLGRFTVTPRG